MHKVKVGQLFARSSLRRLLIVLSMSAMAMPYMASAAVWTPFVITGDESGKRCVKRASSEVPRGHSYTIRAPKGMEAEVIFSFDGNTVSQNKNCHGGLAVCLVAFNKTVRKMYTFKNEEILCHYVSDGGESQIDVYVYLDGVDTYSAGLEIKPGYIHPKIESNQHLWWHSKVEYKYSVRYYPKKSTQPAKPITHLVRFNANGGSGYMTPQTVTEGKVQYLKANAFTRSGYVFKGWSYTEKGIVNKDDRSLVSVGNDITLWAVWQKSAAAEPIVVSFDPNGGTGTMATQAFTPGTQQALRKNSFARTGYAFSGWKVASTGKTLQDGAKTSFAAGSGPQKLVAQWKAKEVSVCFLSSADDYVYTKTVTKTVGSTFGSLPTPTACKGYAFVGWFTADGTQVLATSRVGSTDTTCYGRWTMKTTTVSVSLDVNGGQAVNPSRLSYVIGDALATTYGNSLPVPVRTGYLFVGWSPTSAGTSFVTRQSLVTSSVTALVAIWKVDPARDAAGRYVLAEGKTADLGTLACPFRLAGAFSTSGSVKGTEFGSVAKGSFVSSSAGVMTLYQSFGNVMTEIVSASGTVLASVTGGGKASVTLASGSSYVVRVTHLGVRKGGTPYVDFERVAFEAEVTRSSPAMPYLDAPVVSYVSQNVTDYVYLLWAGVPGATEYIVRRVIPPPEEKAGATATYSNLVVTSLTTYQDADVMPGTDVFYEIIARNDKTVSKPSARVSGLRPRVFSVSLGGSEVVLEAAGGAGTINVTANGPWTLSSSQAWFTLSQTHGDGSASIGYVCKPNADSSNRTVTLTSDVGETRTFLQKAGSARVYTTFDVSGGETVEGREYVSDLMYDSLPDAEREGYDFEYWVSVSDGTAVDVNTKASASASTLKAVWKAHAYRIAYDPAGGEGVMPDSMASYGETNVLSACTFERKGYVFAGWSLEPDGEYVFFDEDEVFNLCGEEDGVVTVYALWDAVACMVDFDANGGVGEMVPAAGAYGTVPDLPPNAFSYAGRAFAGWATSPSGEVVFSDCARATGLDCLYDFSQEPPRMTLYACWNRLQASAELKFSKGYTWISTHVEPDVPAFGDLLSSCLFADNDFVKSSDGSATYYRGKWYCSPLDFKMVPGKGYVIKKSTAGDATIAVPGSAVPTSYAVGRGWNWIGPTTTDPVALSSLRHSGGFADNDVINSSGASATYWHGKWYGTLDELVPGTGYKARFDKAGILSLEP